MKKKWNSFVKHAKASGGKWNITKGKYCFRCLCDVRNEMN